MMVSKANDPTLFYEQLGFTRLCLQGSSATIIWSWRHPVNNLYQRDAISWSYRWEPYRFYRKTGCGEWIENTDLNDLYIRIPLRYRGLTDHLKLIEPWLQMLQEMGLTIKPDRRYQKWIGFEVNDLPGSVGLMAVQLLRSLCLSLYHQYMLGGFNDWYGHLFGNIWFPKAALFWKSLGYPTYLALWAGSQGYAWWGVSSRTPYYGVGWLIELYRQYDTLQGVDTKIVPLHSLWCNMVSGYNGNTPKLQQFGSVELPIPIKIGFTASDYQYLAGPYTYMRLLVGCSEAVRFMEALIHTPLETMVDNVMSTYFPVQLGAQFTSGDPPSIPPPYITYARCLAVLGLLTCDLHLIIKAQLLQLINKTNVADLAAALKQNWSKIAQYAEMRQCVVAPDLITKIVGVQLNHLTTCQE